ncbi:hypothetical protein BJV74DRAFT_811984 [Russula compacta]|nr:hypothetical protein BJV74DRAFT_811984 [Russula compacta]
MTTRRPHRYHGHLRHSYICTDPNELVELRAYQRTYHGAYMRTALGILSYSLTVLKLFDHQFYRIGLVFTVLAALLCVCAYLRARHSRHNYADREDANERANLLAIPTVGQERIQFLGRPFVTAGNIVALVACIVFATEIALLVLVLQL